MEQISTVQAKSNKQIEFCQYMFCANQINYSVPNVGAKEEIRAELRLNDTTNYDNTEQSKRRL